MRLDWLHVDGLVPNLALRSGWAHVDAHTAAGAVVGRNLNREVQTGLLTRVKALRWEPVGKSTNRVWFVHLHPDRRMGTHQHAPSTVDAD